MRLIDRLFPLWFCFFLAAVGVGAFLVSLFYL